MLFSCKISNSFINFLEDQGEDLSFLYESSPIPMELLRDPSYWISAPQLETLLKVLLTQKWNYKTNDLVQEIGHQVPVLRSWGVLDSVLKIIPHPREIFQQPEKFLAYFISPEPPVENLKITPEKIAFDLPLVADQYPIVTRYLTSAFEALPKYSGQGLAQCEWQDIHIRVTWPEANERLFQKESSPHISPKFLQNIIDDLQKNQKDLEEKNRELMQKNDDLVHAQKQLGAQHLDSAKVDLTQNIEMDLKQIQIAVDSEFASAIDIETHKISHNLARLHDYMVRAQQLITMLSSQVKMNAGIKEAMRRMDWDYVKAHYPQTISESMESVRKLQKK